MRAKYIFIGFYLIMTSCINDGLDVDNKELLLNLSSEISSFEGDISTKVNITV